MINISKTVDIILLRVCSMKQILLLDFIFFLILKDVYLGKKISMPVILDNINIDNIL
jgi:hypothetical protein